MSQHLITEFVNRTYVFKPIQENRFAHQKVKKYQGSNRKNNITPEMDAESTHLYSRMSVNQTQREETHGKDAKQDKEAVQDKEPQEHIDITV